MRNGARVKIKLKSCNFYPFGVLRPPTSPDVVRLRRTKSEALA